MSDDLSYSYSSKYRAMSSLSKNSKNQKSKIMEIDAIL